uniref:Peptidase M14 carboxypeptidase A domain-containing protein n=1 Tax=Ditylenchus dipsaci TaxID=166011 RepID=A0A915EI24_9BILA
MADDKSPSTTRITLTRLNKRIGHWARVDGDTLLDGSSTTTTPKFTTTTSKPRPVLYKVVRVVPETGQQLALLDRLEQNHVDDLGDMRLNFWTSPVRVGIAVDIMVRSENMRRLRRILDRSDLQSEVIIEDVESLIIQRERKPENNKKSDFGKRFRDAPLPESNPNISSSNPSAMADPQYDFHHYGSYPQMVSWMRSLARRYPKIVQFISIGKSHEGRSIDGLEIGSRGLRKRAFWVDGGIHAREWAAPHTALFFIHQLTSKYGHEPNITRLVNEITWLIIPLLNPDESGSSDDPCSEIYQGKGAFSEPEARAVRDAVLSSRYRGRIDGFITLHTYSQIWIHPYGHKKDSYPGDVQDLYNVGKKATVALSKLYGTKYLVGSGADTLCKSSIRRSEDWAKESAAIKFVYLLELRPDEKSEFIYFYN